MELQRSLSVMARVVPSEFGELEDILREIGTDPGGNQALPFGQLEKVHYARFVLLPEVIDLEGDLIPPTLLFTTNFNGSRSEHLKDIVAAAGDGLDQVYSHCVGYPKPGRRSPETRLAYLRENSVKTQAFYVNTEPRTVRQIADEGRLRKALQGFLDTRDWSDETPGRVHEKIREFVGAETDLKWALTPPESDLGLRIRRTLKVVLLVLVGLAFLGMALLLPLLVGIPALVLLLMFLVVLRLHEVLNYPENILPPNERMKHNEADEDLQLHNELSAVGFLQKGLFRRLLFRVLLWVLDFGSRNIYYRGNLAGVDTINFARWVTIDGGRRAFAFFNYDGSLDSYNNDFVDRIAFGLNLGFGSANGWPLTRYVLFDGANDEQGFKFYLRNYQVDAQVWYTAPAYVGLTEINIGQNAKIRAGLATPLVGRQAEDWLRLL